MQKIKQVILIRKDLNMRRGKEIAQGSHAAMDFLIEEIRQQLSQTAKYEATVTLRPVERDWILQGTAKVCLRVNSETELLDYHKKALAAGLKSFLIEDSGRTEFHGQPTFTACALGPDESEKIDLITGDLILY